MTTTTTPNDKKVGDTCEENEECESGSCFESICECRDDDDCNLGYICNVHGHASDPFLCISGYLDVGESCDFPIQCASNSCFQSVCECRRDSDCHEDEVCNRKEPPFSCVLQEAPSLAPSSSNLPSSLPSSHPSLYPSTTFAPSNAPSTSPSDVPSMSNQPSISSIPSRSPTAQPSSNPSTSPSTSTSPSDAPSFMPSRY